MKIKIRCISLLALLLFLFQVSSAELLGQDNDDLLSKKITLVLNDFDEEVLLQTLSYKATVPIGFEEAKGATRRVSVAVKKGTVQEVLDAFVMADPRYKWEMVSGVINVVPKQQEATILDVVVDEFCFRDINLRELGVAIADLPEVSNKLSQMNITQTKAMLETGRPAELPRFSIDLPPLTLKEILNELLRRNFCKYWVVKRYGENNERVRFTLI